MDDRIEGFVPSYDGTRIFYRAEGEGFPLVICNGILCSTGYWVYLRPFFRNRCRVITWDYRGHGRSELPRHPWNVTIGSFVRDLESVMNELDIRRAVLVGHSMGVQTILEFTRRYPDRVLGLVPVCGTYGHPFRTFYDRSWPEKVMPGFIRHGERYADLVARVFKPLLTTRAAIPIARATGAIHWYLCPQHIMKDYFEQISTMDFRMAARAILAMQEHSAEDMLRTIEVPTLIVAGEQDPFTPAWLSEQMWRAIPGAEYLLIPRGTHTALVESPLMMHLRMEVFLRDHFLSQGYRPLMALGRPLVAMQKKDVASGRQPAKKVSRNAKSGGARRAPRRAPAAVAAAGPSEE